MKKESERINFHRGFYAAMEVEYDLAGIPLIYEQEIELGKEPVRLDFLIIKKEPDIILHDPIGEFFRPVNIFEYKSPYDGLSIDDFYKAQGYCLIYKSFGRQVNELPIENITLTLVRHIYPRVMIKALKESGIVINKTHPGIYRFEGKLSIPIQLVVSSEFPPGEYDGLRLIAHGATIEDAERYADRAIASNNGMIKNNAGTVINICFAVNKNIEEANKMYENEGVRRVFRSTFEKERQEGLNEGRNEVTKRVAVDMLKKSFPLQVIEEISQLSEDAIRKLAASQGLTVS